MKNASRNLFVAGLLLAGISVETVQAGEKGGWKSLFNGKDLKGWVIKSGEATYKIEDDAIVGTTKKNSPNTFLCTKRKYGDFELEFEVNCDKGLNSGCQIRSALKGDKFGGRVNGPQVEIEHSGTKGAESGYIYGEAAGGWRTPKEDRTPHKHYQDGKWNHYRIVAKGPVIETWINGNKVTKLIDEEIYQSHPKGLIGLQVHGVGDRGPFQVRWRKLRVKEL
ncbi:MAG: 3-keto-disaccharide hydrolase [Limisphaerales bacterium]